GVEQVFALEVDLCAAQCLSEALGEVERSGTTCKILEEASELCLKTLVGFCDFIFAFELCESRHEGFGHIAAAVGTEAPGTRLRWSCGKNDRCHGGLLRVFRGKRGHFSLLKASVGGAPEGQLCDAARALAMKEKTLAR